MFYRGSLDNTDVLYDIIEDPEDRVNVISKLKEPRIYVLFNTENTICIIYEPSYGKIKWMNGHCFSKKEARGKQLKIMFWSTGIWLFENTDTEVITGVIPPELRRYGLFLGIIGATRQFEYEGTVLYTYNRGQVPEFKDKLKSVSGDTRS